MKLSNALFANVLLAGGLLAVPAIAADNNNNATLSSGTKTDVIAEGPGGGGERPDWKKPRMSDDQLIQMAALKDKFLSSTASQRDQLQALHRQLRTALAKTDINRSEVLSIQSQMNSIRDDLANKKMNNKLDFIALLTPEQKEHFRHHMLVANAFGGHGHWGRGGGGCGGPGGPGGPGGHHHHHGPRMGEAGGPEGPGAPGGGPRLGLEGGGPGPVAFEAPDAGFMGPEGPDGE
jgi:Spy/CpxP family protein refolding chaperone